VSGVVSNILEDPHTRQMLATRSERPRYEWEFLRGCGYLRRQFEERLQLLQLRVPTSVRLFPRLALPGHRRRRELRTVVPVAMWSHVAATHLVVLCSSCGKITTDGGPPDTSSWGSACVDPVALKQPPTCDLDAGPDATLICQSWATSAVDGSDAICNGGQCIIGIPGKVCTPGAEGDALCVAWFQTFSKIPVHAKCWPPGPNDPPTNGNTCAAADSCGVNSKSGYSYCNCGSQPQCAFGQTSLCLDTGGVVSCGPWCQ